MSNRIFILYIWSVLSVIYIKSIFMFYIYSVYILYIYLVIMLYIYLLCLYFPLFIFIYYIILYLFSYLHMYISFRSCVNTFKGNAKVIPREIKWTKRLLEFDHFLARRLECSGNYFLPLPPCVFYSLFLPSG